MARKILFWLHLGCGLVVGIVVLMMSVTGVLLTYERQILAWAENDSAVVVPPGGQRLPLDALALRATDGFVATALVIPADPATPVVATAGRERRRLDPYTGATLPAADRALPAFFSAVTGWHRWFNAEGDERAVARAVTGASNLAFLFLVLSGIYLWLPKLFKWRLFRLNLWFLPTYPSSRARDYNWHHVLGIWSALPLIVVVATATVFSYGWANALVYRAVGEEPPARRGPVQDARSDVTDPTLSVDALPLEVLRGRAAAQAGSWRTLTVVLPSPSSREVEFRIDRGNGGQPQHRETLVLDAATGDVVRSQSFSEQPAGQRLRAIIRFLHTGEVLGLAGQTLAGLVSLTTVFMVWTGFALAWRRLVQPVLRRRTARV